IEARGTEASTLLEAGVAEVAGIIAGTDNDANNLSIIITARQLNPKLFTVGRQNNQDNAAIFKAAQADVVMQPGVIVARHILGLIIAPLLDEFLRLTHDQNEAWANVLVSRVAGVVEDVTPETWDLAISPLQAPAVFDSMINGETVSLGHLCVHPQDRRQSLPCVPLLIKRDTGHRLLPDLNELLQAGDRILFCGRSEAARHIEHIVNDHQALRYVCTGEDRPGGIVWEWLTRKT
ncbi:MAG: NAD-binding protein, partial [Thiogranum sp.]